MGTFAERTRALEEMVGDGDLVGKLEVDQVYAAAQHEGGWATGPNAGVRIRNHPRGGGDHFLSQPLVKNAPEMMQHLARNTLEPNGLRQAMADNMEDLSEEVEDRAPREFDDLRHSGHPTVTDNGRKAYDRPPKRPRLSRSALKEKAKRRRLGESLPAVPLPD